ncbi:MAG: hypothetical protein ACI9XC_002504, partial [Gammaproteobacteria bacterium]
HLFDLALNHFFIDLYLALSTNLPDCDIFNMRQISYLNKAM